MSKWNWRFCAHQRLGFVRGCIPDWYKKGRQMFDWRKWLVDCSDWWYNHKQFRKKLLENIISKRYRIWQSSKRENLMVVECACPKQLNVTWWSLSERVFSHVLHVLLGIEHLFEKWDAFCLSRSIGTEIDSASYFTLLSISSLQRIHEDEGRLGRSNCISRRLSSSLVCLLAFDNDYHHYPFMSMKDKTNCWLT